MISCATHTAGPAANLRQNGGRGSVWQVVGLKCHPRFSESVGGASPPALLLPSTRAGGDVAAQAVQ